MAEAITAGGAVMARLAALGVEWAFVNSGTDFPPIIEGMAQAEAAGLALPQTVVVPHEHAATGMAHGHWLISGRPQAVMLHTNVGLANGAIGAINAACEHVPMLLMSGRTPVTEAGRFGARTVPIAWGQEMADQTALVREAVKWDYELRFPEQVPGLLDRALAIAETTPKGPVYLSLPREVLCESCEVAPVTAPSSLTPSASGPDPAAIETAAEWIAGADAPLVIAQRGVGDAESFAAFADWAERWGIAVCSWWATHLAIPTDHPCHVGADPGPAMAEADVVLVIDSLAPWWPDRHALRPGARVIQMGPDPLFRRFPARAFPADLAIAGENRTAVPALIAAIDRRGSGAPARARALAGRTAARREAEQEEMRATLEEGRLTKEEVGLILGEALEGICSSVFSELGVPLGPLARREAQSWFQEPHSGGLGWSFPAAMGAQLADPERVCVATMGDGSYIFANPVACHQIAEALRLPVLVIVLNNREWGAVRQSVLGLYPDGAASRSNRMPLTALDPSPDFRAVAEAGGAFAQRVETPAELRPAIDAALRVRREETRCAFIEVSLS
ncbi:MAG: thiamine pyrophosphate-requiring protein [Pseudomonadota bacterium]